MITVMKTNSAILMMRLWMLTKPLMQTTSLIHPRLNCLPLPPIPLQLPLIRHYSPPPPLPMFPLPLWTLPRSARAVANAPKTCQTFLLPQLKVYHPPTSSPCCAPSFHDVAPGAERQRRCGRSRYLAPRVHALLLHHPEVSPSTRPLR